MLKAKIDRIQFTADVRAEMKRRGISTLELADTLDISAQYLYEILLNTRGATERIQQIAKYLELKKYIREE
jgi:transcriptional regulator with XRE-family HTH domain